MQLQFGSKKIDGAFETALFVDGVFKRSAIGQDTLSLLAKLVGPILAPLEAEGTEVGVTIVIVPADEALREDQRRDRARQTQDAEADAAEIERLTAALNRQKAARAAAEAAL